MADTSSNNPSYNILGSEKLNTPGGANPPKKSNTDGAKADSHGAGSAHSADYKKECIAAHNALEDRLREKERLARWRRE